MDQGIDVEIVSSSRSSIREKKSNARDKIEQKIKNINNSYLTVHWDGKSVTDLKKVSWVELLPKVVTSGTDEQLLECSFLEQSAGSDICAAVTEALHKWNLNVVSICCDTTSSNTGCHIGACTLLEKNLNKNLQHAMCRHHVAELALASAVW